MGLVRSCVSGFPSSPLTGPSPPLQTNNHKLATVEKYDPKTDSWAEVAKLQQARAHVCCIGYMGKLWAIGG